MTKGLFTHLHHGAFLEWSDNLDGRLYEIEHNKMGDERVLRMVLIKQIVPEGLPKRWKKLVQMCYKAKEGQLRANTMDERHEAFGKARDALSSLNCAEFHKLVCHPSCPWEVSEVRYHDIFYNGKDVAILLGQSWADEWKKKGKRR